MCNWFMQHYHTWTESVSQRFSKSAFLFFFFQARGGTRVTQTPVLWQHYGNISFSSQPQELHHLTVHIYIQRRALGVCKTHEVTAAACTDGFPFLSNTCCLEWNLFCIHFNINGWYTQIGFQRSMCLSDEPPPFLRLAFYTTLWTVQSN